MLDSNNIINTLISFVSKTKAGLFLYFDESKKFIIFYSDHSQIPLTIEVNDSFINVLSILSVMVEEKNLKVIFYNSKSLYSFACRMAKNQLVSFESLFMPIKLCQDLYYREKFVDKVGEVPTSLREVVVRLNATGDKSKIVNSKIHLPLSLMVIPEIENSPLVDIRQNKLVYPFYVIEGQSNGRMNANASQGFNPHIISEDDRKNLVLPNYESSFIYCDYRSLELFVLAWLTQDKNLLQDISENDPYLACWKRLFPYDKETVETREMSKKLFLPWFYGKSDYAIAKDLNVSEFSAKEISRNISTIYPQATEYLNLSQNNYESWVDYHGRIRKFENSNQARNAAVQGPAAIFCQEHLIMLYNAVQGVCNIHASIHDGFILSCKKEIVEEATFIVDSALSMESEMLKGLKVPLVIKRGNSLIEVF